jgi:hypothetical protein
MEVGSMGGRLFTDKLVFGGCKFSAFGRLTVPHQLLLLTLPTLVACRGGSTAANVGVGEFGAFR